MTPLHILREKFGYPSFRLEQEKIIQSVLQKKDTFVLMPTGGGKSLCYQIPALLFEGLTVVISPLIALMKDQVDALQASGIAATFLNSSLAAGEGRERLRGLHNGEFRLLYVAPERLMLSGFLADLQRWNVRLIAIDEAHCISEWGHDFRPEYRRLRPIMEAIGTNVPIMALTATATPKVQQDIQKNLEMMDAAVFKMSFNRPNLYYEVRPKVNAIKEIIKYINTVHNVEVD